MDRASRGARRRVRRARRFDPASTEAALRATAEARGVKAATLIHAVRVAVTGKTVSPGLFEVLALLGRDRVHARLARSAAGSLFDLAFLIGPYPFPSRQLAVPSVACLSEWTMFSTRRARPHVSSRKMFSLSAFIAESYGEFVAHRLQPECSRARTNRAREEEEDKVAKEDRGFASMDRSKQREIASKGGKAAHQKGTAHEWTSEEAREAGRKGGMASHRRKQEQQPRSRGRADRARIDPSRRADDDGDRRSARRSVASMSQCRPRRLPVRFWNGYNRWFSPIAAPRLALGGRPTVGHLPLEQVIGVRIPASQPNSLASLGRLAARPVF